MDVVSGQQLIHLADPNNFVCGSLSVSKRNVFYLRTTFDGYRPRALKYCKDHGGNLPKIYTIEEQHAINDIM